VRTLDLLTWELVKLTLLVQELVLTLVVPYIKDPKLGNKIQHHLISCQVLRTMSLEELPSVAREKVLWQGRLLLAVILFVLFLNSW